MTPLSCSYGGMIQCLGVQAPIEPVLVLYSLHALNCSSTVTCFQRVAPVVSVLAYKNRAALVYNPKRTATGVLLYNLHGLHAVFRDSQLRGKPVEDTGVLPPPAPPSSTCRFPPRTETPEPTGGGAMRPETTDSLLQHRRVESSPPAAGAG